MEIYLIRHTTPDIAKEICYGQADIDLAPTFPKEASMVLEQLPPTMNQVYTSPLRRCLQLANLISLENAKTVPELQEMNFGSWELIPWNDIPREELNPWMEDFVHQQVPNGESMKQLAERVIKWYRGLSNTHHDKVAIVTHAGPIRILLSEINQTPLEEAFQRYKIEYGEVIKVTT